jgi:hypothetical protein
MTYQNDPHNRTPARDKNSYGWIIGGLVAVAVVYVLLSMYRHNNYYSAPTADRGTVTNTAAVPTAPLTTGSAVPTSPTAR